MQAQFNNDRACYRCRYLQEYALANHVSRPLNVYLKELNVLPLLDDWLGKPFAPHRVAETIHALAWHQDTPTSAPKEPLEDPSTHLLAVCDEKLAKYRAALEAGADPER